MNNKFIYFMQSKFLKKTVLMSLVGLVAYFGMFVGSYTSPTPTIVSAMVPDLASVVPVLRTCDVTASAVQVTAGASVTISWTTQGFDRVTLNGQTLSALNGSQTFTNIQRDTTYTLVATTADGSSNCVVAVVVYCIVPPPPPPPLPTCTLTPAATTILRGGSVNLSWTTQNASSATLTRFGAVALSGSENTGTLNSSVTYILTAVGAGGKSVECRSVITVNEPPTPEVCELSLTKTVSATTARPGDVLTYTITIRNIGTGNCSGSGVRIVDVLDPNLTYLTATQSSNILPGYIDTPLYQPSTRTITWNGDVLTPREEGTMTFTARANDFTCGTSRVIRNVARATAVELGTAWVSSNEVQTQVTAPACPLPPPTCTLTPASRSINSGETVTFNWSTTNASTTSLTDFGVVSASGTRTTAPLTSSRNFTLSVLGLNGTTVTCQANITVIDTPPAPICRAFSATPSSVVRGATSTLSWSTAHANRVVIDNGIGEVTATGTLTVSPLATTVYTLRAFGASGTSEAVCQTTVVVTEPPAVAMPVCDTFTATPSSLTGSGTTTLAWTTRNGISASIAPVVGAVALNGTVAVNISTTTTFTLNVLGRENRSASCTVTVPVAVVPPPAPLSCAANVSLAFSPASITRGDNSVLTWNTTGVDTVRFDQGLTATTLSGSVTVSPSNSTTYTLTATRGRETVSCPIALTVTTGGGGGGGGGGGSPTCELAVTKNRIKSGETVTLRWDSNRANSLVLRDSHNETLMTTAGKSARERDELREGSLRVSPTRDTTYTLTVSRGSADRVCRVRVDVEDIVVTEVRDQQPLVTGIALTAVPHTGFAAGPTLTFAFYALLIAWALYIAYLLVIRRDMIGGVALATVDNSITPAPVAFGAPETIRPDVFVASVRAPAVPPLTHAPVNLPVAPVVGYEKSDEVVTVESGQVDNLSVDEMVTALENHAHAKKALLSSDAIRHLLGSVTNLEDGIEVLNEVILEAKTKYPTEDGWVIVNEKRMRELCLVCQAKPAPSSAAPFIPTVVPEGAGSLAEAIVTGNVLAAYELIGHRPMFALADAAADFDAVYRARKTGVAAGSELLQAEVAKLTDEQILKIIEALTGALDGVYTNEAAAVKIAIMKAIKVVA